MLTTLQLATTFNIATLFHSKLKSVVVHITTRVVLSCGGMLQKFEIMCTAHCSLFQWEQNIKLQV